ncbi:diguanylate cyclase domain-containing protein [Psychromonas sp.]|uniref:diguanylate cyclase domain-containing protein n=1 Tax=Psychromonas sp. TaxID=1884585 RepID=UPI003569FAC1
MSDSIRKILYMGHNIALVEALISPPDKQGEQGAVTHLLNSEKLYKTLAENNYSQLISEIPLSQLLTDKIARDFPLLKTTYLRSADAPKAAEFSVAMEGLLSDEIKETLDYLSIPVYFKDKSGRFLACNSYFSQLFDLTPAQVVGKTPAQVLPAEVLEQIERTDQKIFVEQRVYFYECKVSDFSGRERDLVFRKESVADGKMQIGMVFDITEFFQASSLLEKERVMLRATADISKDLIFFKDLESRLLGCNKQFEKFVGCAEKEIIGKTDDQLFAQNQAVICQAQDREVMTKNQVYLGEEYLTYHNGESHFIEMKKVPLQDKQGKVQGLIGVGRDITSYQLMQKRLKIADTVFENSKECILVTDAAGIIIAVNKACCAACGYSKKELLGSHITIFEGSQHENIEAALAKNQSWQGDMSYRVKNGEIHFAWLEIYPVEHAEKGIFSRISTFVDLNQSKNAESKIQFLSKYDPLTGVFNRIALFNRLEGTISRAIYNQLTMAVILADINGFKKINEQYGHHAGDAVLQEVAGRFTGCIAEKDTVARFGGDQFVIVVDGLANEQDVADVAKNIAAQFERTFTIDDLSVHLSATIGIALCPDDGSDVDTLLGNAEKAMQRGKSYHHKMQRGETMTAHRQATKGSKHSVERTAYHFYTRRLTQHSRQQAKFEEELKEALVEEQFELYYQPQYDLTKRRVIAVEAVLCWNHPQRGPLHSDNFISLAEHRGLSVPISLMMIRKAAMQALSWQKAGINFGRIAISVTEALLSQPGLLADLQTILLETKCAKEWLEFEVDEITFKNYNPLVYENLINLSKMGIALTIDKFGEERPLFRLFEQLTIDKFKLSKHFTEGVYVDFVNRAIQDGLFVMARSLGMTVVSDSLVNKADGESGVVNRFNSTGQRLQSKAMKASEITFYLHCNKRK